MGSSFMTMLKQGLLDKHHFKGGIHTTENTNLLKLRMSNVFVEIVHLKMVINETKLDAIKNLSQDFKVQSKGSADADNSFHDAFKKAKTMKCGKGVESMEFGVVRKLVEYHLDPVETNRLMTKLPTEEHLQVTLAEITGSVEELLEADFDDCIQ